LNPSGQCICLDPDAGFRGGRLRSCLECRDLDIAEATGGPAMAHVIRAKRGAKGAWAQARVEFQMYYVLKGWIEFDYEGVGRVRARAGSCVHQPSDIRHTHGRPSANTERLGPPRGWEHHPRGRLL
jgi:hypothetical protein